METSHPRRILTIDQPDSGLLDLNQGRIVTSDKAYNLISESHVGHDEEKELGDKDVESLQAIISKMQAIRGMFLSPLWKISNY